MRTSTIVMIGFAVLFGLLAVFLAQTWLNNQADERLKSIDAQHKAAPPARSIVVAGKPLRFGDELTSASLREMPWPENALPAGAFGKIADLTSSKRVVLTPIDANEAVLAAKITGPGQRATLSAMLQRRHEGGHHPRQRRRRCRRLRAAGRSRRCRADARRATRTRASTTS